MDYLKMPKDPRRLMKVLKHWESINVLKRMIWKNPSGKFWRLLVTVRHSPETSDHKERSNKYLLDEYGNIYKVTPEVEKVEVDSILTGEERYEW